MGDDFLNYEEERHYDLDENGQKIDHFAPSAGDRLGKISVNLGGLAIGIIAIFFISSSDRSLLEEFVPGGVLITVYLILMGLGLAAIVLAVLAFVKKLNLHTVWAGVGLLTGVLSLVISIVLIAS